MNVTTRIQISGSIPGATVANLVALGQQAPFTVDSPGSLISAVQTAISKRAPKCSAPPCPVIKPVPEWAAGTQAVQEPLTLLHAIGRATSQWSPAVALVSLTSWWAAIRYLLAFDLTAQGVRFSPAALLLRHHQRRAFSEYLGIGAAIAACEAHIFGRSAHIADADMPPVALALPPRPGQGLWPDYYLYGSGGQPVVVLECKGNSDNPTLRISQLARGACQAARPAVPGTAIRRLAVGTVTRAAQRWFDCAAVEVADGQSRQHAQRSTARWREAAFRTTASKALGWAGAFNEAASVYAMGDIPRETARPIETAIGPLVAQRYSIFGVQVTTGVEWEAYQAFRTLDVDALDEIVATRSRARSRANPDRLIPFQLVTDDGTWSVADDGSVLGINVNLAPSTTNPVAGGEG